MPCSSRPQTLQSLGRGDGRARLRLQVWLSEVWHFALIIKEIFGVNLGHLPMSFFILGF